MNHYGRARGMGETGAEPEGDSWHNLGDARGRFESRPPDGVTLRRDERRALALVTYAQMQAEERHFGGHRVYREAA